jgi:hypothetical protein
MKRICFLFFSVLLWGISCQSKQDDDLKAPEIPEESEPVIKPAMTLYDKPLSTIQKVIEGEWKVYCVISSGIVHIVTYPENMYIEFRNDSYVNDDNGNRDTVYFTWEKHQIEDWRNPLKGKKTYMMCDKRNDYINNKWFCHSINNDTLYVEHGMSPTGRTLVRVK